MFGEIDEQEAYAIIVEYLERLGVASLRQPYQLEKVNKSALVRYLIAEKLQEALDNPPAPTVGKKRFGRAKRKRRKA